MGVTKNGPWVKSTSVIPILIFLLNLLVKSIESVQENQQTPQVNNQQRPNLLSTTETDGSIRTLLDTYQRAVETLKERGKLSTLEFHSAQKGLKQKWQKLQRLEQEFLSDKDVGGSSAEGRQRNASNDNVVVGSLRKGRELLGPPESLPVFNALGHDLHRSDASTSSKNQPTKQQHRHFIEAPPVVVTATQPFRQPTPIFQQSIQSGPTFSSSQFGFPSNGNPFVNQRPATSFQSSQQLGNFGRIPQPSRQPSKPQQPSNFNKPRETDEEDSGETSSSPGLQNILPLLSFLAPNAISRAPPSSFNTQLLLPNSPPTSVKSPTASASPIQLFNIEETLSNLTQGSRDLPGWSDAGIKPQPLMDPFPLQDLVCSKVFCCDTIFDRQATAGCCVIFALQMKVNVPCCSCMGFEVVNEGLFPGLPNILGLG